MEEILKISEKILKQVGIALNTAKLYPPGHPMFEKMVEDSLKLLLEFPRDIPTLSFYFFENTVIVEKEKLDVSKIPAIQALIKYFGRINVKSLSIDSDAKKGDWEALYKMLSMPIKELKATKDVGILLHQLGAERIRANDVEFGIISTRQRVEIKFDIESVIENIRKGERISKEEAFEFFKEITGVHPENLHRFSKERIIDSIKKFEKDTYAKYGFIEPENLSVILSQIFESLSPDLRNEIIGEMVGMDELKEMAREIIKSLPEEELLRMILSLKGELREKIMQILPEEKREKVKEKSAALLTQGEYKGMPGGMGLGGRGVITPELEEKIEGLYKILRSEREENKIKVEISKFLNELIGAEDYTENPERIPALLDSLKTIAAFLLERYGMDAFEDFSLLGSHVLSLLTPDIKRNVYEYLSKTKEMADIIRGILPTLPDEELVSLFATRVKNFPEETNEIVKTLPEEKIAILREKEVIEGGYGSPFAPSRKLLEVERLTRESHLVITGEKKFEAMKKELKEGIRTEEISEIIKPFLKDISSEEPDKRKAGVQGLGSLFISFLESGKLRLAMRILMMFREKIREEEDIEVFFTYLNYFEKGYTIAKIRNLMEFIEIFESEFKELLDIKEKRKFVLKSLGKTKTDFALRMLLTTLWEEENVDEIKEALLPLGEKATKELLGLFPEVENLAIRKRILDLLVFLPEWDIEDIKSLLFDKRWSVQRDIIYLIGEKRMKEMVPFIEELALKGQDIVRKEAVKALGKMGTFEAEEILIKAMEDKNEEIRREAVKAICSNINERILPKVKKYLKENIEKFDENTIPVIVEILRGIKKAKDKEIIPILIKIIDDKKLFGRPAYPAVLRREAVKTLAEFKEDENIMKKLKSLVNEPDPEIKAFIKVFLLKHGK